MAASGKLKGLALIGIPLMLVTLIDPGPVAGGTTLKGVDVIMGPLGLKLPDVEKASNRICPEPPRLVPVRPPTTLRNAPAGAVIVGAISRIAPPLPPPPPVLLPQPSTVLPPAPPAAVIVAPVAKTIETELAISIAPPPAPPPPPRVSAPQTVVPPPAPDPPMSGIRYWLPMNWPLAPVLAFPLPGGPVAAAPPPGPFPG
jgi:hypothetical protein